MRDKPRFAQHELRNAGQLVCIDPSLGMAEFISNSAILTTIRPCTVLTATPDPDLRVRKMADFGRKSAILRQSVRVAMLTHSADRTTWTGNISDILRGLNSALVDLINLDRLFRSDRN